jgi:hypothetical protein
MRHSIIRNSEQYTVSVTKLLPGAKGTVATCRELPDLMEIGDDHDDALRRVVKVIERRARRRRLQTCGRSIWLSVCSVGRGSFAPSWSKVADGHPFRDFATLLSVGVRMRASPSSGFVHASTVSTVLNGRAPRGGEPFCFPPA